MTQPPKPPSTALTVCDGYEVGYGKPPRATRFKPGQSGNPKGRPKGAKSKRPGPHEDRLNQIILEEAYREVPVRDGSGTITIPMAQAVIRSLAVNAAKGQHRAQRLFAEVLSTTELQNRALHDSWLDTAMTYKIAWEKELHRREQNGITDLPDPLPHPDHIQIDMRRGTARVVGPATREEKAELDSLLKTYESVSSAIKHLAEALEDEDDPEEREDLERHIVQGRETLKLLEPVRPFLPKEENT